MNNKLIELPELPERTSAQPAINLPFAILDNELANFKRFHETCLDGESYDVPVKGMERLSEIGLVRRLHGRYFEETTFGCSVLAGDFLFPQPLDEAQDMRREETMTENQLRAALKYAFQLGQTYWQQADSESYSENKESDKTAELFRLFVDDTVDNDLKTSKAYTAPQPTPGDVRGADALDAMKLAITALVAVTNNAHGWSELVNEACRGLYAAIAQSEGK
jgi:hypothetical protein